MFTIGEMIFIDIIFLLYTMKRYPHFCIKEGKMDNIGKSLLEEVYEIMQKELPVLSLRAVAAGEKIVGTLKPLEIALLVYQEGLLSKEVELLEHITSLGLKEEELYSRPEMRQCEILRSKEDLAYSLLWDCILSRFPGEDETTLEIRAGFQIVKTNDQLALLLVEAQNPNPHILH